MASSLHYDASAAHKLLKENQLKAIELKLMAARDKVLQDVELLKSGREIPTAKHPLDAGFVNLPHDLLGADESDHSTSLLRKIETVAAAFRGEIDRLVILGIGGSYLGARSLAEALLSPYHNELSFEERSGVPRVYFEGNNFDNDATGGLLNLLRISCDDRTDFQQRWGIVVISKSGETLETSVAFRLFRQALDDFYGAESSESRRLVVPITGGQGKLRDLATAQGYENVFSIPDNVGGRFSVFTAVGLFPAAAFGLDVQQLLQGAADMTERFCSQGFGQNPVLDYTATCHLMEAEQGLTIRVFSTCGSRLESVGLWYDQLLAESLGKAERGATPITMVNTRDLHSRGQQHQQGARDKLITNVIVQSPATEPILIPTVGESQDPLDGKTIPDLLSAAVTGTNRAYADVSRPTANIVLPHLDEYALGQLLQMFMLATVLEGRLIGINPYGQPGVEAYKKNMTEILRRGNPA